MVSLSRGNATGREITLRSRPTRHMMSAMNPNTRVILIVSAILLCASVVALGQHCPEESSNDPSQPQESTSLVGRLIYHDGLRKWFELKLDRQACGQPSIELFPERSANHSSHSLALETFKDCRVRTEGVLGFAVSGYYTLDINQSVEKIEPIGKCVRRPPFPDYLNAKPDRSVRRFRVDLTIDYKQADRPIFFRVTSDGRVLQPWQAYASYFLTGGYVLYGHCAEGFIVDRVFGDSAASPEHFEARGDPDDAAMFGPSETAAVGKEKLSLGYTCVRAK